MRFKRNVWITAVCAGGLFLLLIVVATFFSGGQAVANYVACGIGVTDACNARGVALVEEGRLDEGAVSYKMACTGGNVEGCCNLGLLKDLQGDNAAAAATLTKACEGGSDRACAVLSDWEKEDLKERLASLESAQALEEDKSKPSEETDGVVIQEPTLLELCEEQDYEACLELCRALAKMTASQSQDSVWTDTRAYACKKLIGADNKYTAEGIYLSAIAGRSLGPSQTVLKMFVDSCGRGFKKACVEAESVRLELISPNERRLREGLKQACADFVQDFESSGIVRQLWAGTASYFGTALKNYADIFRECSSMDIVDLDITSFQEKRAKGFRTLMRRFASLSRSEQVVASKYCQSSPVLVEEIRSTPEIVIAVVDLGRLAFDENLSRKKRLRLIQDALKQDFGLDSLQTGALVNRGRIGYGVEDKIQAAIAASVPGAPLGDLMPATEALEEYLVIDTRSKPYDTFYEREKKMIKAMEVLGRELAYLAWLAAQ